MSENKPNRYGTISKKLSNSELEYRLEHQDHFQHLAIVAARNELLRRETEGFSAEREEKIYTEEELEELRLFEERVNGKAASFISRFLAHIIDVIVCFISLIAVYVLFNVLGMPYINVWLLNKTSIPLLYFLAYYVFFWESSSFQATVGKRLLKIKVVDRNGDRLDIGRAITRYFSKILSGLLFLMGYVMLFFDLKKRTLHDRISKTHVIKPFENNIINYYDLVILDENV